MKEFAAAVVLSVLTVLGLVSLGFITSATKEGFCKRLCKNCALIDDRCYDISNAKCMEQKCDK